MQYPKTTPEKTIARQADELSISWVLTATNEGTFGNEEACRITGNGASGSYKIYTQVGSGKKRVEGWDPDNAPGYARTFWGELSARQSELRELRKQIALSK